VKMPVTPFSSITRIKPSKPRMRMIHGPKPAPTPLNTSGDARDPPEIVAQGSKVPTIVKIPPRSPAIFPIVNFIKDPLVGGDGWRRGLSVSHEIMSAFLYIPLDGCGITRTEKSRIPIYL